MGKGPLVLSIFALVGTVLGFKDTSILGPIFQLYLRESLSLDVDCCPL